VHAIARYSAKGGCYHVARTSARGDVPRLWLRATPRTIANPKFHSRYDGIRVTAQSTLVRPLSAGLVIGGRFRAHHRIASGGMGGVWVGEHVDIGFRVALKVLLPHLVTNPEMAARFRREAVLLGRIRSDRVVRVVDFLTASPQGPVLVMDLVDGSPLQQILKTRRLGVEEAIELGIDIAAALREIHAAHIVHRDVKPANVIMKPSEGARAVLVDLGVSRLLGDAGEAPDLTEITSMDRAVGTFEYMAPEQVLGSRSVTAGADLYSLGAILFRAVSGRNVFGALHGGDLVRTKLSAEPPPLDTGRRDRAATGLQTIVARALSPSPADRYEAAEEMLLDLSHLRSGAARSARGLAASGLWSSMRAAWSRSGRARGGGAPHAGDSRRGVWRLATAMALLASVGAAGSAAATRAQRASFEAPAPSTSLRGDDPRAESRTEPPCKVIAQRREGPGESGRRSLVSFVVSCEEAPGGEEGPADADP
jgi:hypothetical protein